MNARNSLDLTQIEERKKTFLNWAYEFISIDDFAEAGFFLTRNGSDDTVECFSCGIALGEWETGDDPLEEHRSASPKCPYLISQNLTGPSVYPEYETVSARLKSFETWTSPNQTPSALVEAGFFYTGESDSCKCYYCGVGLDEWQITDQPWEAHAYYSSDCDYVSFKKGKKNIDINASDQINTVNIDNQDGSEEDLCTVCCTHETNVVLVPCGHIFCSRCSLSVQTCPSCRLAIEERIKFII